MKQLAVPCNASLWHILNDFMKTGTMGYFPSQVYLLSGLSFGFNFRYANKKGYLEHVK